MKYLSFLILFLGFPLLVFAQDAAFVPLTTNAPFLEGLGNADRLPDFLNNIYRLCIGVAAVLAVLQIMRAGIMYMGGDSVTEKKEAKNLIAMSIGGLVLVLSPVVVFSLINPSILSLEIKGIEELKVAAPVDSGGVPGTGGVGEDDGDGDDTIDTVRGGDYLQGTQKYPSMDDSLLPTFEAMCRVKNPVPSVADVIRGYTPKIISGWNSDQTAETYQGFCKAYSVDVYRYQLLRRNGFGVIDSRSDPRWGPGDEAKYEKFVAGCRGDSGVIEEKSGLGEFEGCGEERYEAINAAGFNPSGLEARCDTLHLVCNEPG